MVSAQELSIQPPTAAAGQGAGSGGDLPAFVTNLFNVGMSLGFGIVFVSLAIAGVMYFLSPISANMKSEAKDRISGAISGLLILLSTYLIITTINPQLSVFKLDKLQTTNVESPNIQKPSGVYFYKSGCSDDTVQPNSSSISNLGILKNRIKSVGIVQNANSQGSYITILYDNINFWGKCQYIGKSSCTTVEPFAASASIHEYDENAGSGKVYLFRKSCLNDKADDQSYDNASSLIDHCKTVGGGYYEIKNSGDIDVEKLDDLRFEGVPEDEQNCIKYDKNGLCAVDTKDPDCIKYNKDGLCKWPPSLSGENISSIIIDGNYVVLLVYFGPNDNEEGPWTSCQEFPTMDDVNKFGPRQVKWENIRNSNGTISGSNGVIPNYVIVIPIK